MFMQTASNPVPATRATIWSVFAAWACRTLERLPARFPDVEPVQLRLTRPF
jgi:hypothetical protein